MPRTIVIGVGNPVISDDGVGLEVARRLRKELAANDDVTVAELYDGGLELMEAMAGYDRAFVIDAIVAGSRPGTIFRLRGDDIGLSRNTATTHDGSLSTALSLGILAGLQLPGELRVWAIEAGDVSRFHEGLTRDVEAAVPQVLAEITRALVTDWVEEHAG